MNDRNNLTLLEIQNLMLETLNYKGEDIDPYGNNFFKYGYQGTQDNLFKLMEALAIKKKLIKNNIRLKKIAWGVYGYILNPGYNTNFNIDELKKMYEAFHILLNRGIIAPGAIGNYGPNLPNFHVTDYGRKCLEVTYILPYDSERYLNKLSEISNLNVWIKFYIEQSLECFNSYCYEAALIMIGLSNEVIIEELISNYLNYLNKHNTNEWNKLKNKINKTRHVSKKYSEYLNSLNNIMKSDGELNKLSKHVDKLASETFMSYVRLTRNELSHPNEVKIDRITSLMIFISFIDYCERQYTFINYFKDN